MSAEPQAVMDVPELAQVPVYVVDDHPMSVDVVSRYLTRAGYSMTAFAGPLDALAAVRQRPPMVLVTDYEMPAMNGIELARKALEFDGQIRVILMTGAGQESAAQAALRLGAVDYLTKPIELPLLDQAVRRAVFDRVGSDYSRHMQSWLKAEVKRKTDELRHLTLGALTSLVRALESRSEYFRAHSQNVAVHAAEYARYLELPSAEVEAIRSAGLLHDVGMIAVPDAIIDKPGELSPEEYDLLKTHCQRGAEILEPIPGLEAPIGYIVEHHERWNGSGYPYGLAGHQISLGGQIVGLAETWIALSETRAHRGSTEREEALRIVEATGGFSPTMLEVLRGVEDRN